MYCYLELLICLHFAMASTRINRVGVSLWCGQRPFQVLFQCFDVATRYLEEILLDLIKTKKNNKQKEFTKHIECSDVIVECE